MSKKSHIGLVILCLFWSWVGYAQTPRLSFKHLTSTQGLSQNHVYSILQDHHGFMWFATQDGVNKYDGYKFTVYKNDPENPKSISGNFVRTMCMDKDNNLWMGSLTGLSLYDSKHDNFIQFKHDGKNQNSISHDEVTSVYEDKQGNLWVGTIDGLNRFNRNDSTFTRFKNDTKDENGLSDNFIWTVYEDSRGNLWIGTLTGGLNVMDRKTQTFRRYQHDKQNKNSISSNRVTTIMEDSKGNLWIGTIAGLNLFDRDRKTFTRYMHDSEKENSLANDVIYSMYEDRKGNLWIGTLNSGLSLFYPKTGTFTHYVHNPYDKYSISNNTPSAIYEDRNGIFWVGVHRGGINYFNPDEQKFTTYQHQPGHNSLSNNNIKAFTEDHQGRIWISMDGGALSMFDRKKNLFKPYRHDPSDPGSIGSDAVVSVLADSRGEVWAGTFGSGLDKFDSARNRFIHYRYMPDPNDNANIANVWYIMEDKDANLWISDYSNGFYVLDRKTNAIRKQPYTSDTPINLNYDNVRVMYREPETNNLWIGTFRGGLSYLDIKTYRVVRYAHDDRDTSSISSNEVLAIFQDHKKRLWIGTRDGLNLFDRSTKTFKVYNEDNGLPNAVVQSIAEDDHGNLWLGTLLGLSKFNPDNGKVKNYTEADGLQGNEFSRGASLKARDGLMFFGGINGFNTFYPDSIVENNVVPPVLITDFQIFNKPVIIGENSPLKININDAKEITLPAAATVFSFEFAALNYVSPTKNQYAYKLEGFDEDWNYVGSKRSATYTNLDPATYYFHVKASNNDGSWNENGTTVKIVVTPPIWKTWWFKTLSGLAFVIGLIAIYRYRMADIKKRQRVLEGLVQQRTEEIASQNDQLLKQQTELEAQRNSLAAQNKTIEEKNKLLENQHVHLEKLVDDRTMELLKTNEELKDKNQRLEQYGFMTSHNFRGPVASLLGLLNIFNKEDPSDPENLMFVEKMEETTLKIDEMIKDMSILLDQETHIETLFENVNLEEVLQNVNILLAEEIKESNVSITYDFSEVQFVRGIPAYINSMFYNLISNAIKFRKEDNVPQIEVRSGRINDVKLITFKDNGAGIDMKKHATSIFHPFKRFQPNIPGKGLGLYLVKTQLKAMNGDIRIESQKGKGSTFMLIFNEK